MSRPKTDPWSIPFHQDFAISGLGHGLIFPQKSIFNYRFFKNKSKLEDIYTEKCNKGLPAFIRVLVGTKRALQEWLKSAGPGSCSLWAEIAEEDVDLSKPDAPNRLFKGRLHMAYRLRSATPLILPVFPGTHLILSPQVSQGEESLAIQEEALGKFACGKWHSLRQKEKEKFLKSIGVNYLGDYFCVSYGQSQQGLLQSENWIRRWLLGLPVGLYGQLTSMSAPGGTLWQFQQLVERIVNKPFFVDVDFELIDFRLWLEHHAYITILERSDFLVILSTLQWTVVRFNFAEDDHIMITGDRCLNSLQQLWKEKKAIHQETDGRQISNGTLCSSGESGFGCPQGRKWKLWHSSDQEYGLHRTTLLEAMYNEGGFSESKFADVFRQDFGFLVGVQEQNSENSPLCRLRVQELRSCHLTGSPLLSSKERCALSNLGSSSRTVRQRGMHILLDILLGELKGRHNSSLVDLRSDSLNGRGISTPVSGSSISYVINGSTSRSGELSSNESSRVLSGSEKGENIKVRDMNKKQLRINPNVQTDGLHSKGFSLHVQNNKPEFSDMQLEGDIQRLPLSYDHTHSRESEGFEFSKMFEVFFKGSDILQGKFGHCEISCKLEAVQMKLLEWVQGGFLECLIEDAVCSPGKGFSRKEVVLSVEETADICLKVTSALPADSTARIVNSMMIWLKDCSVEKDLFNGLKLQEDRIDIGDDSYNRDNIIQTLREELEKLWCSTKLLLLLIRGSTFIASGIARCGGMALIFEIYTFLVKLGISKHVELNCPVPEIGRMKMVETLPGGVLEHKRTYVKVPPFPKSFFNGLRHQQSVNSCTTQSVPYICDQSAIDEDLCIKDREKCKVLAGKIFKKVGHALQMILLCRGRRLFGLFKSKLKSSRGLTSVMPDTSGKSKNEEPHCINDFESVLSPVEKLVSSNETRPKVPKLMLRPCLSEPRRKACHQTENIFWTTSTLSASSLVKTSSETLHNSCAMVLEAKVYLLEVYVALLLHSSAAAVFAQQELVSKLPTDIHTVVSVFMVDLFSCLGSFPQSDAKKLQDLIFEVMYRLDKLSTQNDPKISIFVMDHDSQRAAVYDRDCSPLATGTSSMTINKAFLEEALESLRVAFSSSSHLPQDNIYADPEKGDSSSLASQTWQSMTTLLCILAECHTFFAKKGLPCLLKEDVAGPFAGALSLFSELGEPNSWSLHQILAMQSLLHLIKVIFQGLRSNKSYPSSLWMDYEEQIWQVIVNNKKHWACVKGYLSWFILESCHGCLKNLLNYWKFCSDTPEALALLLFSKPEFCLESPGFGCLRDAFECLGFFVTLFNRRLCAQSAIIQDNRSFLPEDMVLNLDFLMNPVDGLIMSTLKGPCFQGRTIHTEREIERYALDYCRMAPEAHISLTSGSHELDVSPSCKLSSGKFSTTSVSDLGSSARILTEKNPSERLATQTRCGIKSWRLQTPNIFKVLNGPTYGMDLEGIINRRSSSVESSDHSLSSRLERFQCLCKTCATKLTAQSLSLRISMLIEQKSLDLLAQVFRLKFTPDFPTKQLHGGKPAEIFHNPFSSKRYVNAFLDFHFLSFLQLYNWKTDGRQKKTSKQHTLPKLVDCTYQVSEDEGSSNLDVLDTFENASPNAIPSLLSDEDTIISACQKHGEVLLSLAQNQSGDVSRRFKELRVMDFLMHQITLEYDLSHVATPREPLGGPVSSDPLLIETQYLAECALSKRKSDEKSMAGESSTLKKKRKDVAKICHTGSTYESRQVMLEESKQKVVDVTTPGRVNMVAGRQRQSSRKILYDMSDIDPDSARLLQSAGLINDNPSLQHHLLTCISILQRPVNQHGSFTCRAGADFFRCRFPLSAKDEFSPANVDKNHHSLSLRRQEFINFYFGIPAVAPHSLKMNSLSRKVINWHPPREIPIEKRNSLKCFDKSHKQCDCLDLNQYENSSFLFNDESCESTEKPNCPKDLLVVSSKINSNLKHSNSQNLDTTEASPDRVIGNRAFVYSGRFCDLNEEVENELEREDAEIHLELDTKFVNKRSKNAALKSDKKILEASPTSAKQQTQKVTSRPLVPKLNLPKSARKGDELEEPVAEHETGFSLTEGKAREPQQTKDLFGINEPISGAGCSVGGDKVIGLSYERERMKRRIYSDCKLHVLLLELFVSLMITPQGSLETCYTDRFPMDGQKMNAPFYLLYHINHAANSEVRPLLRKQMRRFHPSVFRILKLLWRDLFDSSLYTNRKRIAHGAFAQIYTATFTQRGEGNMPCKSVVLKTVNLPKGPHEPCKFFDIYSEVEILEKFTGDPRVCQLLDYGVDIESFILVLKHYKCSLRYWRQRQKLQFETSEDDVPEKLSQAFHNKLPLYLEIYSAVLQAVRPQ